MMPTIRISLVALATACWLVVAATANAQIVEGGTIEGTANRKQLSIHVRSADSGLDSLASRAFRLHGVFSPAATESVAQFVFTFNPGDADAILLEIHSRGQKLFSQSVSGTSRSNAVARAADLAVLKTTGQTGFFAGKLAFVSDRTGNREIFTSDLLFTDVQQLTSDRSNAILPSWSTDGSMLLYTGYFKSGFPDLFLIDIQSGRRTTFAGYRGTNSGGVFSPDARNIAMILSGTGNAELYIGPTDLSVPPRRLTANSDVESDPTWSPDGQFIALTSDRAGGPQLYRISAQGGPLRRIPTNLSGYCTEPDWNPAHPGKLVFTAATRGGTQLAIHDFDAGKSYFLTQLSGSCAEPEWLNDGRHVVFTRSEANASSLWIIDTESGSTQPLSPTSVGNVSSPSFAYPQ